MQLILFGSDPLLPKVRAQLRSVFVSERWQGEPDPLSQLIHSMVSARTQDPVSWEAFLRLSAAFPGWNGLGDAAPQEIQGVIATVTHADNKALQLRHMIRVLRTWPDKLDLSFLAELRVEEAMTKLQTLPGVGVKSAATTLNFSRLKMRALVVDTHVHRVTRRLGLVGRKSLPAEAYSTLMESIPESWTAEELFELHWLFKGLSQKICTDALPRCGMCPLKAACPRVDVAVRRAVVAFPQSSRSLSQTSNS